MEFSSKEEHREWLKSQCKLPKGFRVGTSSFSFTPDEVEKPAEMTLSLIALDKPTEAFSAVFTKNAVVGAPVIVGRERNRDKSLGAVIINNKISNVCAPGGVEAAEALCSAVAKELSLEPNQVFPSSTGVIGWKIPVSDMTKALPAAVSNLQNESALPLAEGIMTTDLFPKVRSIKVGKGTILAVAKGAGMIEPNMATMLLFILTDFKVTKLNLRKMLPAAMDVSFNAISVDSDQSTSDTALLLSSGRFSTPSNEEFLEGLKTVCKDLAQDVVRNGEGVKHVMHVSVKGAPTRTLARAVGKSVINSPLVKSAVCGNDPNVGRIVMALGNALGDSREGPDLSAMKIAIAGQEVFRDGVFHLNQKTEDELTNHFRQAELYQTQSPSEHGVFEPAVDYPPHERMVEISIDLALGERTCEVWGADLTHEYVSENADYRS